MRDTIYLDAKMVPSHLRGSYNGKMFKAVVCTEMTIPSDAGLWSGGSRDKYSAINFSTGEIVPFPGQQSAPWDNSRADRKVTLEPGFAVVTHTIFSGKDLGLTFYLHPDNATKLLPPPTELSENEAIVLDATASLKSSYNGKDRYQMKCDDWSYSWRKSPPFMSRDDWEIAKQSLIAKGLLNKAGAITVNGRNANKRK
jgi:hypothetical protein